MTPDHTTVRPAATAAGRMRGRLGLLLAAAAFAGTDLGLKAWVTTALDGRRIEGGLVDLQLAYNPGVAFSLGANAPGWTVLAVTGLITAAVAVALWRTAGAGRRLWGIALAAILGGALANLIDRAADGQVTDYLHTGWWPTFNLADTFIVLGGLTIAALSFREPAPTAGPADEQD
ncbi:signal peptidase II [Streptomyces antibioticus]|uniref:signal peptidase II n=1 Tax=Streptomyces antibioticus TaxID=1890 RepID=UPI002258D64D|nr:signal peptidase II [Streptomyces antibioticus]MCX5173887.1 signal peptidase II [Streptomyces antibioticus]